MMKFFLILLLLSGSFLYANVGKITALKGSVQIVRASQSIEAKLGSIVNEKDNIKTGDNSRAQLIFKDNTIISVGKNSSFSVQEYLFEPKKPVKATFSFGTGVFKTITGKIGKINANKFKLNTKSASIGIRGTIVGLDSKPEGDIIIVPEGQIEVITPEGVVVVNQGQMTEIKTGEAPVVKEIPKQTQEKMEKDSGSKENEQESGQGEATQTTGLTKEEKEEAKEQQSEEKAQKDETTEEKQKDEEKAKEEKATEEEQKTEETKTSEEDSVAEETPTSGGKNVETETDDPVIVELEVKEPEVDVETIVDNVAEVVENTEETVATTTETTTTTTTTTTTPTTKGYNLTSLSASPSGPGAYDTIGTATRTLNIGTNGAITLYDENSNAIDSLTYAGSGTTYANFSLISGQDISFTKELAGSSQTVTYDLYADNLAEFLVGYKILNLSNYDYEDIFYSGVVSTVSNLSRSKILHYSGFRDLVIKKNASGDITSSEVGSMTYEKLYLNPQTKSFYFEDSSKQFNAEDFNAGYLNSDGSISYKVYENSSVMGTGSSLPYSVATASGYLYGSEFQGIGMNHTETEYTNYSLSGTEAISKISQGLHTYTLDEAQNGNSAVSGTINYTGSMTHLYSYGPIVSSDALTLSIDRTSGTISGTIKNSTELDLEISGIPSAQTSYYIDDDLFGAMIVKGNSSGIVDSYTNAYIENTGWIIALPDDIVAGVVTSVADDESSWGYWTADYIYDTTTFKNINPHSTWVAGVETNVNVASLISDTVNQTNLTFQGHVIGAVIGSSNIVHAINMDANNYVNLNFTLGSGTGSFTGDMNFQYNGTTNWNTSFSGNATSSGFNVSTFNTGDTISGTLDGKYYGTDSIKSVGGNFNFINTTTSSTKAFGSFKAGQTIAND